MAKSAIGIKKLYYGAVLASSAEAALISSTGIATLISSMTEITNVHQDTWALEEGEPSQDSYKNQLTKSTYRMGDKQMGDITIAFEVGQYDWTTKAALLGGSVMEESNVEVGWKRARGITDVKKSFIAITEDNVAFIFPKCNVLSSEGNTDGAISIKMSATVLEPEQNYLSSEYWFDYTPSV